ncbi:HAMP domain-containing sensor histidine kinase [Pseudomonas sp. SA3-5]|uniref:histidine kinase n=1 Tax=Pseudomonas aestuarii TaxID=3018340 RepID=A0ABT4XJA0_9PSED|nr:HAMP domain-containing sensor histidine kinase [Pseudomonas aestuarii]MDA7088296.1 HAMP domain-containing sensor histidine kinase [Pseudomonas aestuarii]
MKPAASLQRRLGLGLTLGITLLWLLATAGAGLVVQHELDEAFDSALEETAQRILPLAVLEIVNREEPRALQHIASLQAHKEYLTYLVRDNHGNTLLQSHDADLAVFNAQPLEGFTTTSSHRLYAASALRKTVFIEVAEPLAHRHEAAWGALQAFLLPLLLLIPLSLFGTWLLVRLSLRSVLAYRRAIETRGAGDLSPIKAARLPAEINPLADAVNHLMERLRRALEAERSFTANSAHELRTPLAATLAQVQRLRREIPEGPLQERATQIEASLRELARLSEKLMQLAKAEGGGLLSETPQDLLPLLAHVVEDLRRTAGGRLHLQLPSTEAVLTTIDPDAFAILLRNLIENAMKHGASDQPIEVSLSSTALLQVVNAGPLVPPALLAQLSERFVRGPGQAEGSGLGLAIAAAIAQGVGARLLLASPAPGKTDGFAVSVQFAPA